MLEAVSRDHLRRVLVTTYQAGPAAICQVRLCRAAGRSGFEMNPDPPLLSPDDAAGHMAVVGFDHQREAFGNPDGGGHLECGAGFGKVADRAVDGGPAAKRNPARLQKPPPWCNSVLVHHLDLRLSTEFSTLEVTIPLPYVPAAVQRKVVA